MQSKTTLKRVQGYNMKLDIETVIRLINGVGFPIFVCIVLFWNNYTNDMQTQTLINEFKLTIQNNTHALNQLSETVKGK